MSPEVSRAIGAARLHVGLSQDMVDDLIRRYADTDDVADLPAWIRDFAVENE